LFLFLISVHDCNAQNHNQVQREEALAEMPPKLKSEATAEWKSRFPVARIKKIMQADDDVGKVAQVVPVIISKALELFMQSLVEAAAHQALATGHKRVLPGHLKLAVKADTKFDFLEDHVEKVPDVPQLAAGAASGAGGSGGNQDGSRRSGQRSASTRGRNAARQQGAPAPISAEDSTMSAPGVPSASMDFNDASMSNAMRAEEGSARPQSEEHGPPLKRSRVNDLLSPSD
jgi:histone H3/H4